MFKKKTESFVNKKKPLPPLPDISEETLEPEVENAAPIEKKAKKKEKKLKNDGSKLPFFKNRALLAGVSIGAAFLLSFVVSPLVNAASRGETETIVIANKEIPKGTRLEAAMLQTMTVPASVFQSETFTSIDEAVGRYAAKELSASDPVTATKTSEQIPLPDAYLYELPENKLAISVSVKSFSSGLSSKLLPGDVVTVYASLNGGEKEKYQAIQPAELTAVEILAVTAETGADLDEGDRENPETVADGQAASTVTLLANPTQAAALAGLEQNAVIHLALAARNGSTEKSTLMERQEEFFMTVPELPTGNSVSSEVALDADLQETTDHF